MTNYQPTRIESLFFGMERQAHNFFYDRPHLRRGPYHLFVRLYRIWRSQVWNRLAYNRDGRIFWYSAWPALLCTAAILLGVAWLIVFLVAVAIG
mgnify:CR=1 FL=1